VARPEQPKIADRRAHCASRVNICKVLEQEMKPLYLLAFLVTANHEKAERCFGATAEQALKEQSVVEEWARSWIKRCLIKNAIGMVKRQQRKMGLLQRGTTQSRWETMK
jgi:hypothetical protein